MSASVFPAYVGMSPEAGISSSASLRVPRIRGDEPPLWIYIKAVEKCSPHTWG